MLKHHPLHPALVHFPIAFLTAASLCDVAVLMGYSSAWAPTYPLLSLGVLTALLAMIAGLPDLMKLRGNEAAEKCATQHMTLMGISWCLYLSALLARNDNFEIIAAPTNLTIGLSLGGFLTLSLGGWQGGKLVYYHAASVRKPES